MDPSSEVPSPTPGQSVRIKVTDMAYGGDAVGKDPASGLTVFTWPAIAGEDVTVTITERRRNLLRSKVLQAHAPSPLRVEPACPYFGRCGGCQWQHISYDGQVASKGGILRSQLARIGGVKDLDSVLKPPVASPRDFNYRNTSHFAIEPGTLKLAYFKRDSHSLIPVSSCPISTAGINAAIPWANAILQAAISPETQSQEPKGMMRVWKVAIRSSEATGQTVLVFHSLSGGAAQPQHRQARHAPRRSAHGGRPDDGPELRVEPEANPIVPLRRRDVRRAIESGVLTAGEMLSPVLVAVEVMDDGTVNLLGQTRQASRLLADTIAEGMAGTALAASESIFSRKRAGPPLGAWAERLDGLTYWVPPDAFFQVNTQAAELLLAEVESCLPRRMRLFVDAHCGVGTFALAVAKRAARIIGFETDHQALMSAQWMAALHGATHAEFRQGRAEHLLPRLAADDRPDVVLLDPPRAGCHPHLLAEIVRRRVPRVIYVSCDPSTLARDIKTLSPHYRLTSTRMVDMFPQTYHIESVAVLELIS